MRIIREVGAERKNKRSATHPNYGVCVSDLRDEIARLQAHINDLYLRIKELSDCPQQRDH